MWDYRYYLNLVEERDYAVDHEALRRYFPFDAVLEGMLGIYKDVFGLEFTQLKQTQSWHDDVMLFEVFEVHEVALGGASSGAASGGAPKRELLGYFYLDLWPRPNKFTHAACWPLQPACAVEGGGRRPAVTALVCNFPKPGPDGAPSLLEHNEVVTFFHEFGHGVHNLCSRTQLARFAGTATERDFVEAPSQMLENWCWERDALARLSRHVDTGAPIPTEMVTPRASGAAEDFIRFRGEFSGTRDGDSLVRFFTYSDPPSPRTTQVDKLVAAKNANVGLLSCRQ